LKTFYKERHVAEFFRPEDIKRIINPVESMSVRRKMPLQYQYGAICRFRHLMEMDMEPETIVLLDEMIAKMRVELEKKNAN